MPILKYDNICNSSINEQSTFGKTEQISREELSLETYETFSGSIYI